MNEVYDIMSSSPVTVEPTTSIGHLLTLFDRHDFNAFPVIGKQDRLLGIVSKLDVLKLFLESPMHSLPEGIANMSVADVMHRTAVFLNPHDAITSAGSMMVVTRLRSLPVIERRAGRPRLVGILSRGDVLRWLRSRLVEGRGVREGLAS
jgi:CBS domain-containing protein